MRKHLMATCALLLLVLIWTPNVVKGEQKQRTVVLVYDDSGSMRTMNRWMYASYALQSFVGLLYENDIFSYVPMSTPDKEIAVSLTNRQSEMHNIRSWNNYKNTPFQSVETAIQALKRQAGKGADELWLIVLTDGAFNELEDPNNPQYEGNKKRIASTLRNFKSEMDQKKVAIHTVLITMESHLSEIEKQQVNTFKEIWQDTTKGIVLPTDGESGIINSVNAAAALVANRDPFSHVEDAVKTEIKDNHVKIISPFPVRRITLVQQGTQQNARVKTSPFEKVDSYVIETPQPLIQGYITHLSYTRKVIQPGTYDIILEQPPPPDTRILVEPDLDYKVTVYKENTRREVNGEVYTGDPLIIEAKPEELPTKSSYFAAYIMVDKQQRSMTWNEERKAFQYRLHATSLRGSISMNIKGFYQQTKEFQITAVPKPKLSLRVETVNWKESVTELVHAKPLVLQPLLNGKAMTKEELKNVSYQVRLNKNIRYELHHNEKLYVYLRPLYSNTFNFTETGNAEATVTMKHPEFGEVSQSIMFTVENTSVWQRYHILLRYVIPSVLVFVLVMFVIVGWIVKPRFHRRALVSYELDQSLSDEWIHKAEPEVLRGPWWKLGIPYRAERRTVQSITFVAKKGTKAVLVAKECQVEGMVIDGSFLQQDEIGAEHRTLYPNETIIVDRGYGKETYWYECD
jgi:hypothetical protein